MILSDNAIAAYAHAAGFTDHDLAVAVAVCLAESGGKTDALGENKDGTQDHGLWQINTVNSDALAIGDWTDPAVNARMARIVFRRQGWHAWATYNDGIYSSYMPRGLRAAISWGNTFHLTRTIHHTHPYMMGEDVKMVQRLVGALPVDGIYGPISEGKVRVWQAHHGLTVDGEFGPRSANKAGWTWG